MAGLLPFLLLLLSGCATLFPPPPSDIEDACAIFSQRSSWRKSLVRSRDKWGVPIHVQLAIIHQESKFRHDARPPRDRLFWFIPWRRPSTAYGYAQALDDTWDWYKDKTGNDGADRDDFDDAVDFIGWYVRMSHSMLGIPTWDAYNQYLAYHEGHGGYARRTYLKKRWLLGVANKVKRNALRYQQQMELCEENEPAGWMDILP
ncbi:MAG: lytic transglycosylase [Magnetococcales bacterium]|nr:lytic transglycosylase [Magnetococcales bacterium]